MSIRILVVDDHAIMRAGLCALLNAEPGLEVVGEANNGAEALRLAGELTPDILLMDVSMPGMGGIEATQQLVEQHPGMRVLMLTMYDDKELLREAMRAGASGYIIKRAVKSELIRAIQVVMDGNLYVDPTLTRALLSDAGPLTAKPAPQVDALTEREIDVLRLLAQGYTNNQIAQALFISVRTVEFHRSNLMDKLHARSRVDLVRYASEHGLLKNGNQPGKDQSR